jgi:hypothetical protein
MDTTIAILIAGAVIVACLLLFLFRESAVPSVIKEPIDGATLEKCPHCDGVVGASLKDSVIWRISKKDVCPHCNHRIKR